MLRRSARSTATVPASCRRMAFPVGTTFQNNWNDVISLGWGYALRPGDGVQPDAPRVGRGQ
ncbi:hypothetical protein MyNCGM152_28710 [Achromobacter xylosoxidans]